MPQRPNFEIRLRCTTCKEFIQSINPIIIKTIANKRFHNNGVCSICNKFKIKYLKIEQVNFYHMKLEMHLIIQLLQILLKEMIELFDFFL